MKKYVYLLITLCILFVSGCGKDAEETKPKENKKDNDIKVEEKIDIINVDSNSRPYAVIVNNYPTAVKVQTGLNDAYIVYEFPVEGGMTRSLALYKDKETSKIGTVRSARHNFLDYVMENDAIFVHFGWSHYAESQVASLGINNINGLVDSPFWRENPEGLATEHTAYTSLVKCVQTAKNKGYRLTTEKKVPLNYVGEKVELNDGDLANTASIVYSDIYKVEFKYDSEKEIYTRYVNGVTHTDYFEKTPFTTKNILILKTEFSYADDNYYLEIKNVGSGSGYYVTNGKAKKITWEKKDRASQTTYKYEDGTDVKINDGNTYIMFRGSNQSLSFDY